MPQKDDNGDNILVTASEGTFNFETDQKNFITITYTFSVKEYAYYKEAGTTRTITKSINVYCKVVILPSTKIKSFKEVVEKLSENISSKSNLKIIIQPSSPLSDWSDINFRLFNSGTKLFAWFPQSKKTIG